MLRFMLILMLINNCLGTKRSFWLLSGEIKIMALMLTVDCDFLNRKGQDKPMATSTWHKGET